MEVIRISYEKEVDGHKKAASEICYKCSACSNFCPVTMYVEKYDLENSFIVQLFKAEKERALRDVWMCCACEKCFTICPQDGDPAHVFTSLKEASYKAGLAPDSVYAVIGQVLTAGSAYEISKAVNATRTKLGLKEMAPNAKVIDELQKLAKRVGLKKKGE